MKKIFKSLLDWLSGSKKQDIERSGRSLAADIKGLQRNIGYSFNDPSILKIALIHTSCFNGSDDGNLASEYERMEFLGDSILGMVTAEYLFFKYPNKKEGFLSKFKSQIVSEKYLSVKAKEIKLGEYIKLGDDEFKDKGFEKKSILSNMMESLICAIYFDGGMKKAEAFIRDNILNGYKEELTSDAHINYKSKLQEYCQVHHRQLPIYEVVSTEGPEHKKMFTVTVSSQERVIGSGIGLTKKNAEQNAAKQGCETLKIL